MKSFLKAVVSLLKKIFFGIWRVLRFVYKVLVRRKIRKTSIFRITLILIVIALIVFVGGYLTARFVKPEKQESEQVCQNTISATPTVTVVVPKLGQTPEVAGGEYSGWNEFSDEAYDYKIDYPKTWTLEKDEKYKMVAITTPDEKYKFEFGAQRTDEKTGLPIIKEISGGDIEDAGKITVLDTEVKKQKLVINGKTKQYYYPKEPTETEDGKYIFVGAFSINSGKANIKNIDLEEVDYRPIAEKILKSVEINP